MSFGRIVEAHYQLATLVILCLTHPPCFPAPPGGPPRLGEQIDGAPRQREGVAWDARQQGSAGVGPQQGQADVGQGRGAEAQAPAGAGPQESRQGRGVVSQRVERRGPAPAWLGSRRDDDFTAAATLQLRPGPGQVSQAAGYVGLGLELNVDYAAVLALDLGGDVLFEHREGLDVPALGVERTLDEVAVLVVRAAEAAAATGAGPVGVTVAAPGLVESAVGTVTFRSRRYGKFPVEVRVDTTDRAAPRVELTHATRDGAAGRIAYRVGLTTTRPRYGGER